MNTETSPILDVQNLRTEFRSGDGWQAAVHDLSMQIHANETLAVVGESGSGKSVTALSILRLLPPGARIAQGNIRFDGRDLTKLDENAMADIRGNRIAMIFQEPMTSLNPTMKVGDQIAESLSIHRSMGGRAARAEALALLDRVRIPSAKRRMDEFPHQFSGGMRQRVMIAIALACRPKLLIADEPTTALDVTIQAQILQLIKELQDEEKMGVLFITHDMGVVAEIADRALVMRRGDVVETGDCRDIFARPQHPYTRTLLFAVPRLGAMGGSDRPTPFPEMDESGKAITPPIPEIETVRRDEEPLLQVQNLTTRFDIRGGIFRGIRGRVHAVENVSFDLRAGETLALVGESGCGKSTTGRSILHLEKPSSGDVLIAGQSLSSLTKAQLQAERCRMQMIFQDPFASLDPRQTIGAAIAEPLLVHGLADRQTARNRVAALLEQVGLPASVAGRYPHEFSGGQRQRICIARALGMEPRLIVADESVSALDVSIKAQIVNLMLDLQARLGLAYLFISHDMAVVERISHRVAVMYLGEIVEIGPRAQVFGNPQHPYTRKLLSAVPVPDPLRRRIREPLSNDEVPSPVRAADYVPPQRRYRQAGTDHLVMEH
ncbi:Glutathione import ATP-binding protein GsiA [Paracoccus haematequi]|uniref:Glutathione import ATP-binding protein GsiA n=1 Tax=Paracoccus haematequi TaxID=2491866 RepID=A0A447ISV4_9RHOB|nr:ABC transporter ATP-binding protein [Paracoccus haematequi]VDS10570.1 Glutathione import ATP-binding protein GsiA [Paracoccus haematequi]